MRSTNFLRTREYLAHILILFTLIAASASQASAAASHIFTVDTKEDVPGLSACTRAPGDCSLRGAIERANIAGGIVNFAVQGRFVLTAVELSITTSSPVLISAAGAPGRVVIDARSAPGVLAVVPGGTVSLEDITFAVAPGQGSGINAEGAHLTATGVSIQTAATELGGVLFPLSLSSQGSAWPPVLDPEASRSSELSVGGRVLTEFGRSCGFTYLYLTLGDGAVRTTTSSTFGYFRFDGVPAGNVVVLEAWSLRYGFQPQVITVLDDVLDIVMVGTPE